MIRWKLVPFRVELRTEVRVGFDEEGEGTGRALCLLPFLIVAGHVRSRRVRVPRLDRGRGGRV
jgi:hypothetical protein